MEYDILQKRGSWISYNGTQVGQGRDAVKEILRGDEKLYTELEEKVKAMMAEKGGAKSSGPGAE